MEIKRLDHVNVRTSRLAEMIEWYETYIGLKSGPRPDFGFGGAWLYNGDHPMVHLVEVDSECASLEPKIEHFALAANGYSAFVDKLHASGISTDVVKVPGLPIVQVNVEDCDGNHIHIDFPADEV
ncbi:MAG: VOC family protein [Pseudomonadota bacterium]